MAQNAIGGPAIIPEECQPLDPTSHNIRLLELLPGKWTDELSCRMFVVSLDDDPYYEALSYVWGEPDLCRPIWVNGSPRSITRNLDRALRRLRQPSRTRVMWIDALCINQSNVEERSHQVNMMGTIFSRTAEALLFLADYEEGRLLPDFGLSKDSSPRTQSGNSPPIENATGISENSDGVLTREDVVRAVAFLNRLSNGDHFAHSEAEARSDSYAMTLQAIEKIVSLPWWNRIWTVQEAALPPQMTVIFGSIHVPWLVFSNAASYTQRHHDNCCSFATRYTRGSRLFFYRISAIAYLRRDYYAGRSALISILHEFRYRRASDPRDKVFALIGLGLHDTGSYMDADYTLTTSQLYQSFVRNAIGSKNDLFPLLRAYELGRRSDLPSWVPDWSAEVDRWFDYEMSHLNAYSSFNASNGTTAIIYPAIEPILSLSGVAVDQVAMLGCYLEDPSRETVERAQNQWKELLDYENIKSRQYVGGGTYEDAFWRLLVHDIALCRNEKPQIFSESRRTVPGDYKTFLQQFWTSSFSARFSFCRVFLGRFFITNRGYIGIGSHDTKIGDCIYVLHGGKVPFILRPVEYQNVSPSFQYIGHAFVHGIMDGEAMQNPESQAEVVSLV